MEKTNNHNVVEQIVKKVNDESIIEMVKSFDKWKNEFFDFDKHKRIPPICWECVLAEYLLSKYNAYASDKAVITFEKKEVKAK